MKNEEVNRLKSAYLSQERQLGRYRKKVADMEAELKKARETLQVADGGIDELRRTADGLLAQIAITYGKKVTDEETGEVLGWRLTIDKFSVADVLGKYTVAANYDPLRDKYVVGVFPKEAEAAKEEAPADAG